MSDPFSDPPTPPDVVDDQASDVLNEADVVQVPVAIEQLVESQEMHSTFPPEVPNWEPDEPPDAAE
jgi:hypothetical protein